MVCSILVGVFGDWVEIFELAKRPKAWSLAAEQFSVAQVNLGNDERFCRVCSPEVVEYVLGFSEQYATEKKITVNRCTHMYT